VSARHVHVDTTSFSVSGAYAGDESADSEASVIAITYGYSRDHREDLKQWMLALATTQEGDVPLFLRPLDGSTLRNEPCSRKVDNCGTVLRVRLLYIDYGERVASTRSLHEESQ